MSQSESIHSRKLLYFRTLLGSHTPILLDHEAHPADQSLAKAWIKNPDGAICRSDRMGRPRINSLRLARRPMLVTVLPWDSRMGSANGLESHPLGSVGKLFRPATVKLLN